MVHFRVVLSAGRCDRLVNRDAYKMEMFITKNVVTL